jgi:hypothetical protein
MLVPIDQLAYNTRLAGGGINRVKIGVTAVVVDARQVKRASGVIEVKPNGAVCVETEWPNLRHFSSVLVDCEESVTEDIDSEHATDWIHRDTDNRHPLWNAEKVADYRRRYFVAPIDAGQKEACVRLRSEVVRTDGVERVSGWIPGHAPPSLDLR